MTKTEPANIGNIGNQTEKKLYKEVLLCLACKATKQILDHTTDEDLLGEGISEQKIKKTFSDAIEYISSPSAISFLVKQNFNDAHKYLTDTIFGNGDYSEAEQKALAFVSKIATSVAFSAAQAGSSPILCIIQAAISVYTGEKVTSTLDKTFADMVKVSNPNGKDISEWIYTISYDELSNIAQTGYNSMATSTTDTLAGYGEGFMDLVGTATGRDYVYKKTTYIDPSITLEDRSSNCLTTVGGVIEGWVNTVMGHNPDPYDRERRASGASLV